MRFELIDRVLERGPSHLVAVKSVTVAEEYLADHFPGFPVLPGVLMLESLVQAGRRFILEDTAETNEPAANDQPMAVGQCLSRANRLTLAEVRNVRYGNMVRPGQSLRVQVTLRKQSDGVYEFDGTGTVDDQPAVQGRFSLAEMSNHTKQ